MIPKMSESHAAHVHELVAVDFELKNADASAVHLAGSFNDWSPVANPLERGFGGRWTTVAGLAPGAYEYCLVVDGQWTLDPSNQVSVDNPFGGRNSVLVVPESRRAAHLIDAEFQPFHISKKTGPVGEICTDGPAATRPAP